MKQSDLNHLRRLLGWVRCDIGQAPAELQQTMIDVADGLGHPEISEEAKARMVETYRRAEAVPLYVRAAVKALEKALAAAGREPGAGKARATAETRANAGFDPGAAAGREPALDDVQVERGLAEIGVHVWGPRAEDWLAGAEYAARILRGSEASPAAEPLQNHPDAAAYGIACRDTMAAPPTLRRDDTGGAGAARRPTPAHGVQEVQVEREATGPAESCRPAITLQVMQEALRLMPSDEARRVARAAEAVSSPVTPEQYVGAGAVAVIAKLRAPVASIREGFELTYAADADDPACAADLFHFTNGWRACVMSQVGKPVVMKLAVDATAAIDAINDEAARLRAPVAEPAIVGWRDPDCGRMAQKGPPHGWHRYSEALMTVAEHRALMAAALASVPDTTKEKADKILRERMAPVSEALGLDVMFASAGNGAIRITTFDAGTLAYSIRSDGTARLRASFNCQNAPETLTVDQVKIIPHVAAEIQPAPRPASAPVAGEAQPAAYLTLDEEGSPCMLFFDVVEARGYCAPGEEPEPLFRHAAPQPSAEDVRNATLEKVAGIVGGQCWGGADSHVSALIAQHIRALKQPQADKDGGQQRAGLTDEQCIAIYDALNDFCGEVDPEEYVMPYLGWPPDNIKQKAIDVMRAALAATGAPEGEAC